MRSTAKIFIFTFILLFTGATTIFGESYRGLIIDKTRFDFDDTKPGDIIEESFTVTYNYQADESGLYREVNVIPFAMNFNQAEDGSTVYYTPNEYEYNASLASWITFDQSEYTLNSPNQKVTVNFKIVIPPNAEPGGKYAVAFAGNFEGESVLDEQDFFGTGMNSSLGPLIFLTVDGEISNKFEVESFYTSNIRNISRKIYFNPPVNINASFVNSGNVHITPIGQIMIYKKNDFQNPIQTIELNEKNSTILPGSSRNYSSTWNDSFISFETYVNSKGETKLKTIYDWTKLNKIRIGRYEVKLLYLISNPQGSTQTFEKNTYFWLIPWQLIALIALIIVYYFGKNEYKRYKNKKQSKQKS